MSVDEEKPTVQYATPNRRLAFKANWFQEEAQLTHQFIILFYLTDSTIEIIESKTNRTFLKRNTLETITENDFYLGAKLNIFGRQFDLVEYGDGVTRKALDKFRQKAFFMIKNRGMRYMGDVMSALCDAKFNINGATMVRFTQDDAKDFVSMANDQDGNMSEFLQELLRGPTIALELVGENCIRRLHAALTQDAQALASDSDIPSALVNIFKSPEIRAGVYASCNEQESKKDISFFFGDSHRNLKTCFRMKNSTLCVIKPHAIDEGKSGYIISDILKNGFVILGFHVHRLERAHCEEFYEVYQTVVPEYTQMVTQLSSGPSLAIELGFLDPNRDVHKEFRLLCGPSDPEIGKLLRPETLRAKYGTTKVLNAVHCTDLAEDTTTEVQYMFQILMNVF